MFKKILKVLMVLFIFIIIVSIPAGFFAYQIVTPAGRGKQQKFIIKHGESASEIAESLKARGLIRDPYSFRVLLKITHNGPGLKAGEYLVSPAMNMTQIMEKFVKGDVVTYTVTIPEGYRASQIASLMKEKGLWESESGKPPEEEFKELVNNNRNIALFDKSIPENLEGYLFPETYRIWRNIKAGEFVAMMVSEFNRKVKPLYEKNKESLNLKISGIITIASLIERESKVSRERPLIAAVYYNRLKEDMLLECDATIQYILGDSKENLTYGDLKIDSPYNTYLYKGLPPGPIANPGLDSIKAAMEPAKVDYLFYVLNSLKNDGSHVFSRDYSQHLENVRKYLR